MPDFQQILDAEARISPWLHHTPLVQSSLLNDWLGHEILFKAECLQKTGSFKMRGALNYLSWCKEQGQLPKQIVANSSGNHAQAVAFAAKAFDIPATIYASNTISSVKAAATRYLGAELKLFPNRMAADMAVTEARTQPYTLYIPPFDHPLTIAGQGTLCLESIQESGEPNAIFAPCGGGGLLSGTLIAAKGINPQIQVIGAEPLNANDAAESLRQGKITRLTDTPNTLADGAATPAVGEHTFPYLQQLDDFIEVDEQTIAYWTQWLQHLLKLHVEPTSAMSMGAVVNWLKKQTKPQKVLVLLTGGNIDQAKSLQIWQDDHLLNQPRL